MQSLGVIGAGAWGTALAHLYASNGRDVSIWALESDVVDAINTRHENDIYLKGIPLSPALKASSDIQDVASKDILLIVSPAQYLRATLEQIKDQVSGKSLVICSKGIELDTGLLMSQVAEEIVPDAHIAVLTGPTFASDIAKGLPGAVTLAMSNEDQADSLLKTLGVPLFRPYTTTDVIGTQLGGAIKNVIAIACGIVHGKKLGESARAALLTRGIAEIARLGVAMGAKKDTLLGMCGVGDLTLTCSSIQSRNFSLGAALGEGQSMEEILGARNAVTEGVHTAKSTLALARKNAVDMPITEAVNKCLNEGMPLDQAIEEMLNRPFKYEMVSK